MNQQGDGLSIAEYGDPGPFQAGVLKHGRRRRQSMTSLARPTSSSHCGLLEKGEQSRAFLQSSRHLDGLGATFQDRLAAVGNVRGYADALVRPEPRIGELDQFQAQLGLLLVTQSLRLHFGLGRPPKPGSVRETEHSVADGRKSHRQAHDNETDSVAGLFGMFWGRTVVLPTGSTDMLAAVLVQRVVKYHQDLDSLCDQRLHQDPEKAIRDHVNAPLPFAQKAIDCGEMPGFVKLTGQYYLTHCVFPDGQHPADDKSYENTETRSTEARPETNLVNPKGICYLFLHPGVPPSPQFLAKGGMRGTPRFFKYFLNTDPPQALQKTRNYSSDKMTRKKASPQA